jgi:DNA-binding transcriptional ArsR family regulator
MGRVLMFSALADSTRRQIIQLLASQERPAGAIAAHFQVSAPAISQHLKVLREARLVVVRVEAQRRIYGIDPAGFGEIDRWLAETLGSVNRSSLNRAP